MMSFFCIFGKHLLSLVMLACRTPRGSIFVVATRDYLLLALTNQPSAALWESRSSPLFLEEFFQKSSSFFVLCSSLSWWRATILTAPLPEGRECIAQLSSYVGAHRCVRPTNAREFHSGRHIGLPLRQNREPSVPGVFVTF